MLRAEGGGEIDPGRDQRVERMGEVCGDRGGMRDQRDAPAFQRLAQGGVCQQAVNAEFHVRSGGGSVTAKQAGW